MPALPDLESDPTVTADDSWRQFYWLRQEDTYDYPAAHGYDELVVCNAGSFVALHYLNDRRLHTIRRPFRVHAILVKRSSFA